MSKQNSNVSASGLVEKYIGTAYDNVKIVADDIENVNKLAGAITSGSKYIETITAAGTRFLDTVGNISDAKSIKLVITNLQSDAAADAPFIGQLLNASLVSATSSEYWSTLVSTPSTIAAALTSAAGDYLFATNADGATSETYNGIIEYIKTQTPGIWSVTSTVYSDDGCTTTVGKFIDTPIDMSILRFDATIAATWLSGTIEVYKAV